MLRGLSVVSIVLFHLNDDLFSNGFLGVDVFFVISGYVVTPFIVQAILQSDEDRSFKPIFCFYRRRFFRLFPALLSTLAVFLLPLLIFSKVEDVGAIAKQAIYSIFGLGNLGAYTISGDYFLLGTNPLIHTWSLAVEEQIYLIAPLFLCLSYFISRRKASFQFSLFSLAVISFVTSIPNSLLTQLYAFTGIAFVEDFSFYSSLDRFWQFGLGGVLALIKFKRFKFMTQIVWSSFFTIVTVLFFPFLSRDTSSLLVSLLVGLVLYSQTLNQGFGNLGRILFYLGNRSYSLYLVHMPIIYLLLGQTKTKSIFQSLMLSVLVVFLVLLLGSLQFRFVEQTMRISTRSSISMNLRPKIIISSALFSVVAIGYLTSDSLASNRLSPIIPTTLTTVKADTHILRTSDCVDVDFSPLRCSWGNASSAKSILLVGDSQAYAAADGFIEAASRVDAKISVGSISGCPFLNVQTSGRKIVDCEKFKSDVLKYIERTRPNVVIIANRTSGYLNPESGWRTFVTDTGEMVKSAIDARKIYEAELAGLVTRIQKTSHVVLFQNIPEPENIGSPSSIWSYLVNRESYSGTAKTKVFTDIKVRSLETRLSTQYDFTLFDPYKVLCRDQCLFGIDAKDKFMDSWHLSTVASKNLDLEIAAMLQKLD
jgi:peptidoglycan/LPS O-acetylase OafA/YrhL